MDVGVLMELLSEYKEGTPVKVFSGFTLHGGDSSRIYRVEWEKETKTLFLHIDNSEDVGPVDGD